MLIRIYDKAVLPRYIHRYRRVIVTTQAYAQQSRILSSLRSLVAVIPNGVKCDRFNPMIDSRLKTELGLENNFTIMFVAALTKWHGYKGLDVLLRAMKIALLNRQDLCLLIVGDGELRCQYERMAAGLA